METKICSEKLDAHITKGDPSCMVDEYKCIECGGKACDYDCDCGGEDEECDQCGGLGYIESYFECMDCGHVYHESDIDYS